MKNIIIFSFLIINLSLYSQQGWYRLNPTFLNIADADFINGQTGYGATFNTIQKTTNAGLTWFMIYIAPDYQNYFFSIDFTDLNTGYAASTSIGSIYKTTNGGYNWFVIYNHASWDYHGIRFVNNYTGFATVLNQSYPYGVYIIKTTDGGVNWSNKTVGSNLWNIQLFGDQTVYIRGNPKFYKSTNAGSTWDSVIIDTSVSITPFNMRFPNINTGYIQGNYNKFYKTSNAGHDWQLMPSIGTYIEDYNFFNADTGFVIANTYRLFITLNGGLNWTQVPGYDNLSSAYCLINNSTGYISSANKYIRSSNFGMNWQNFSDTSIFSSVRFIDSNTGFFLSDNGYIHKTTNGGLLREPFSTGTDNELASISLPDQLTGYVISKNGKIFKTTNIGSNWIQMQQVLPDFCNDVDFVNSSTGFVCGTNGKIFKTVNGGSNWFELNSGVTKKLSSLDMLNDVSGYVCGDSGLVLMTTNGGNNWSNIAVNSDNNVTKISFFDGTSGYLVTDNGKIYKTMNSGSNWSLVFSKNGHYMTDISLSSEFVGFVCSDSGFVFRTTNQGLNWQEFRFYTKLKSIDFVTNDIGTICGISGNIYRTTQGSIIAGITQISPEYTHSYALSQNYPNPFNPATKIKFQIPLMRGVDAEGGRGVFVQLSIHDILGREVAVLVNEQLTPGTYEVEWDASAFPSGVYFYTITSGSFKETRKMVLLK